MSVPKPNGFPVQLDLTGRPCLLVGGGRIALRKSEQLLHAGADLTVIAPAIDPGFSALKVKTFVRPYITGDVSNFWLVVTATGNQEVDQQIFDEAESLRIWCNSADDPQRCSFILPAVHRQGPITISVSTGGASPALASWLRREIAALIGPEYQELVIRLATERAAVKAEGRSTEDIDWRPIIDAAIEDLGIRSPGSVKS